MCKKRFIKLEIARLNYCLLETNIFTDMGKNMPPHAPSSTEFSRKNF